MHVAIAGLFGHSMAEMGTKYSLLSWKHMLTGHVECSVYISWSSIHHNNLQYTKRVTQLSFEPRCKFSKFATSGKRVNLNANGIMDAYASYDAMIAVYRV